MPPSPDTDALDGAVADRGPDREGRVLVDAGRLQLAFPPAELTRPGVRSLLRGLRARRAAIEAAHPALPAASTSFVLTVSGTGTAVDASTHCHVVERMAPALLLLLCRHGFDRVRSEVCADGISLHLDQLPADEQLRLAVPAIAAMAARLLAEARQASPPPLLRHPWLCAVDADALRITVPPPGPHDATVEGRATRVNAVTAAGVRCTLPVQRSLETLYLHTLADVVPVIDRADRQRLADAIFGDGSLRIDGGDAPTVSSSPDGGRRPLTLVLVEPAARPRPPGVRFAHMFSRLPGIEVLLAPWYNLRLLSGGRGVILGRAALRAQGGELLPLVLDGWRPVDALYAHLTDAAGPVGASQAERTAAAHLAALGIDVAGLQRQTLVDRLLCRAARSGTRSNGVGWEGEFALKALLEGIAVEHQRATGEVLARPRTLVASRDQVPAMIDNFRRAGEPCIVKVSGGTRGEGTAVVGPDETWSPPQRGETFVVQELLPRPLLLDGHKADLRCHLLIDGDDPQRSRRIGPVLVRRAGILWRSGDIDAEVVNRARPGPVPELHPLELMPGIEGDERRRLLEAVDAALAGLLDMHRWWAASEGGSRRDREPNRVQHWGVDLFAGHDESGRLELRVLDVNVHPQLLRELDDCDAAVEQMMLGEYLPVLLNGAGVTTPAARGRPPAVVASEPARGPLGIAVLHPGEQPRRGDVLLAAALSRAAEAPAHLCSWNALSADGDGVQVDGVTRPVVDGELQAASTPAAPIRLGVLWADTLCLGNTPSLSDDADRRSLQRLVAAGLADTTEKSLFAHTEQLLLGAARRGVLTNACGAQSAWGDKARLEDMLRACARGGGPRVGRPRTHPVHGSQAERVVAVLHAEGIDCVVKPAVGSWGEGITIHRRGDRHSVPVHVGEAVVQQLVIDPLLVGGHKVDLRCHVVVDIADPASSRRIGPIVARRAAMPHRSGEPLAEITNVAFQESHGVATALTPIAELAGLDGSRRAAVAAAADDLVAQLLAAHAWWVGETRRSSQARAESRRILVWALDILVAGGDGEPRALLAEVNVRPQLVNDGVACFAEVETMLDAELGPAVMGAALRPG